MVSNKYSKSCVFAAITMLLALLWLTISTPFVFASKQAKQQHAKQMQAESSCGECVDDDAPVNQPEEKSEKGVSALSEYLHAHDFAIKQLIFHLQHNKCHSTELYFAYHPDLFSPPPEISS
jgi:hypothetical protein